MLRRAPTTLAITSEDVAAYEDRRAREALLAAQQARVAAANHEAMQGVLSSPGAAPAPDPEARATAVRRVRDDRIGVAGAGAGAGTGARRAGGR
jgi:hypothetical protein